MFHKRWDIDEWGIIIWTFLYILRRESFNKNKGIKDYNCKLLQLRSQAYWLAANADYRFELKIGLASRVHYIFLDIALRWFLSFCNSIVDSWYGHGFSNSAIRTPDKLERCCIFLTNPQLIQSYSFSYIGTMNGIRRTFLRAKQE